MPGDKRKPVWRWRYGFFATRSQMSSLEAGSLTRGEIGSDVDVREQTSRGLIVVRQKNDSGVYYQVTGRQ